MRQRTLFLISLLMVSAVRGTAAPAGAATMRIDNMPLGKVITLGGQKFVKVKNNLEHGSQFIALAPACVANYIAVGNKCVAIQATMQGWTGCSALVTPTGTNFTQGPILTDTRDGKTYEIRKFADGKCWMVDNLAYGGVNDVCASKTTFAGMGSATPTNTFGTGTYGDCRDPKVGCVVGDNNNADCLCATTFPTCGYFYNWQAAMQHASAYYNTNYTGPTTNVQGICPHGWHLPSGNTGGEFAVLDIANGGTGATQFPCSTTSCNFWRPGYNYKGIYSGYVDSNGSLGSQGHDLYLWSVSEYGANNAWYLSIDNSDTTPSTYASNKYYGYMVRCIKN